MGVEPGNEALLRQGSRSSQVFFFGVGQVVMDNFLTQSGDQDANQDSKICMTCLQACSSYSVGDS